MKKIYFTSTFFYLLGTSCLLFVFGVLNPLAFSLGIVLLCIVLVLCMRDISTLFSKNTLVDFIRILPEKLSHGEDNEVHLYLKNHLPTALFATIIENIPVQLQIFDFQLKLALPPLQEDKYTYIIHPTTRGAYEWGNTLLLLQVRKGGLIARKVVFEAGAEIPCYPQQQSYHYINAIKEEKAMQRIGQSMEFEHIREYHRGDDPRHINWKASAKRGDLMLNRYSEEKSQEIYCLIDLSRNMAPLFQGKTYLDYAVNASLALSKAVVLQDDKAGLVTFSNQSAEFLPAGTTWRQIGRINESLYRLESAYEEANFEYLYQFIRIRIRKRSLLFLFTNFENENALSRNLRYIIELSKHHLLIMVLFEDAELLAFLKESNEGTLLEKTMVADALRKKQLIAKELRKLGIPCVLSHPAQLNSNSIGKYLNIKKQQIL
jgi:uncharacterized protein (DUF58 family)